MSREDIERLEQKIARDPDSKLFVPLAEEYRKAGMVDEAINLLVQGLEKQPHYLSARVSLGKIYMSKGLLNEAKEEFQKVITIIPENLYAHKKLAELYQELGEINNSISELKVVLNLNPTDEWAIATLSAIEKASREIPQQPTVEELPESVSVVIGSVQEELEPPQEAFYPEETVDEEPGVLGALEAGVEEPAPGYNTILDAENSIKQGRYSEAMHIYKTIISEDPENKQALQRMAELKTLFKILGKDQETHIMQLERFLEGIKKRRDTYFSST
jgi:tetratricopeptide (TPR) repeat protein